jgi:Mrp family chromosome partitioning ATPase
MQQYLQLFLISVQKNSRKPGKCFAVAFTSYEPEEGVSYVAQSFGVEIAKRTGKRTLIADARRLAQLNIMQYDRIAENCFATDVPNLWSLPPAEDDDEEIAENDAEDNLHDQSLQTYAGNSIENSVNNLQTLRFAFDYILLDCPSLRAADDAIFLAPETDGVMVVVEADRTRRDAIENAKHTIETADGNLLGFILNKRQYTVPEWLYKRL